MKKIVKKVGNSIGITFSVEERKILGMEVDDVLDLTDMIVIKGGRRKK